MTVQVIYGEITTDDRGRVTKVKSMCSGSVIRLQTYRYGPVAKGERFKVGSKGRLVNCRLKSQAKFVVVESRAAKDDSRAVTVRVL